MAKTRTFEKDLDNYKDEAFKLAQWLDNQVREHGVSSLRYNPEACIKALQLVAAFAMGDPDNFCTIEPFRGRPGQRRLAQMVYEQLDPLM